MKNLLGFLLGTAICIGFIWANASGATSTKALFVPAGSYYDVNQSSVNFIYRTIDVSSFTPTLIPKLDRGVQRIIDNEGTGDVWEHAYSSATVTTEGIKLFKAGLIIIEQTLFNSFYVQSSSQTNRLRIKDVQTKN